MKVPGPDLSWRCKSTFKWRENEALQKCIKEIN